MNQVTPHFGPEYYACHAHAFGWGAAHRADDFKLRVLNEHVRGNVVLDVACGPGVYAAALVGAGRRVVGVDFSRELLRSGRAARGGWLPLGASGFTLPLADRSVDTSLLLSVLEHVDDVVLLREVARVTRERLVIQVPLAEPLLMREAGVLFSHWNDRSHLRTYTEDSLRALIGTVGWRVTAFVPAYPRDLQELFVRGLTVPEPVRMVVRALLRPVRRFSLRPPAEAFAVAERQ